MKPFTAIVCLCLILPVFSAYASLQGEKPMTNQDVIHLVKLRLSADVIIASINNSPADFDLTVKGLTMLSQGGVSNEIIKAMQAKNGRGSGGGGKGPSYPLPPDKGAYLWDGSRMHLLYQSTVRSIGRNFWRTITPFVHQQFELQLVGAFAKTHFDNNQPTILVSGLGEIIPGIPSYRWLYVKTGGMLKDRRVVGKYQVGGFFGSMQMMDNEIECETKKVAEGVYAITPLKPLADGEYGLVRIEKVMDMKSLQTYAPPVWDFGVYAEGHVVERKN